MNDAAYECHGILGLAMTPEAVAERKAEERLEQQMYDIGGLREFALCDPAAFHAAFPNIRFLEVNKCQPS